MKRVIQWESQHLEIDVMSGKIINPQDEEQEFDEPEPDFEENYIQQGMNAQIQDVMSTPFGLWRVDDAMNPYRQFKLWMGHTNFSITQEVVDIIKNIPGVEVLQVMTRYRFIIGIGELFDMHDVRIAIEQQLQCHQNEETLITDQKTLQQVKDLKEQLSVYNKWAIYVFPNGNIDFSTSDESNFGQQLNLYRQAVDYSSGILIESEYE
jgi:hypothetical protein